MEIDPEFARAHAALGIVYSNLGESVRSMESTTKAYQLRDRASDRGAVLHHHDVRPAGDGQSGEGAADPRVMGADLSAGSGPARIAGRVSL